MSKTFTKRYWVSGASGFIGRHLVARILQFPDAQVVAWGQTQSKNISESFNSSLISLRHRFSVHAGLNEELELPNVPQETFIHLAGNSSAAICESEPLTAIRSNVDLAVQALNYSHIHGIKRFIFISSGLVYGDQYFNPVKEETLCRPSSIYGATKLAAENILSVIAKRHGIEISVLRLANVYGPGSGAESVWNQVCDQIIEKKDTSVRDVSPVRDFVYIDDVVECLVKISDAKNLAAMVFNVSSGTGVSIGELVHAIEKASLQDRIRKPFTGDWNCKSYLVLENSLIRNLTGWHPLTGFDVGFKKVLDEKRRNAKK